MRKPLLPRTSGFFLAAVLTETCLNAASTTLVLWLDRDLQADPRALGGLLSLPIISYILVTVPLGHVADRFGARRMAAGGAVLLSLCSLAVAFVHHPWQLIPLLAGKGIGAAMFWPALGGWLSRGAEPHRLPRRMAAYNLGWSSGSIIGRWLSGVGFDYLGPMHAMAVYGLSLLAVVVIVLLLPELAPAVEMETGDSDEPPPITSGAIDRRRAWTASLGSFFVSGAVVVFFPPYARQQLGLGPEATGFCTGLLAAVQTSMFLLLGVFRARWAGGRWLLPAQLGAMAGLLLLCTGHLVAAIVGLMLIGINNGVSYTASLHHSVQGRADSARQTGINEAVVGFGGAMGPLLGGCAYSFYGPSGTWLTAFAVLLSAAVFARLVWRRPPPDDDLPLLTTDVVARLDV